MMMIRSFPIAIGSSRRSNSVETKQPVLNPERGVFIKIIIITDIIIMMIMIILILMIMIIMYIMIVINQC